MNYLETLIPALEDTPVLSATVNICSLHTFLEKLQSSRGVGVLLFTAISPKYLVQVKLVHNT